MRFRGMQSGYRQVLSTSVLAIVVVALAGSALAATAKPTITGFTPTSGKAGTKVTITGKNLTGATAVRIGALKATYKVNSATKITATVTGKVRTGKVTVTTKRGTATSTKSFKVTAGTVSPPAPEPVVPLYAPNGSGTLTATPAGVSAGSTGNTIVFTYTAAAGGMSNGTLVISVPAGWTNPVTTAAPGCVSGGYPGVIATSPQTITLFNLTLAENATVMFTYGAKSGGSFTGAMCGANGGAVAPTAAGTYTFTAQQKSSNDFAAGILTAIAGSPAVTIT
jgi:hypothetical protein